MKETQSTKNMTVAVEEDIWTKFHAVKHQFNIASLAELFSRGRPLVWNKVCNFFDNDKYREFEKILCPSNRRRSIVLYEEDIFAIKNLAEKKHITYGYVFAIAISYMIFEGGIHHEEDCYSAKKRLKKIKEFQKNFEEWRKGMPVLPEEMVSYPELKECFDGHEYGLLEAEIVLDNAMNAFGDAIRRMEAKVALLQEGENS